MQKMNLQRTASREDPRAQAKTTASRGAGVHNSRNAPMTSAPPIAATAPPPVAVHPVLKSPNLKKTVPRPAAPISGGSTLQLQVIATHIAAALNRTPIH